MLKTAEKENTERIERPKKLLIVCGQTATGKTNLALRLAHQFSGEVLAADSRHVYKGLDILTGKDIPRGFSHHFSRMMVHGRRIGFYGEGTRIWCYDLFEPHEQSSVFAYTDVASLVLQHIWAEEHLPIAVGGTGLYLRALTGEISKFGTGPDVELRARLEQESLLVLQETLRKKDTLQWESMNLSDRKNPRRLIRKIEIATNSAGGHNIRTHEPLDTLWIGLTAPIESLEERIERRVRARIAAGVIEEVACFYGQGSIKKPTIPVLGLPLIVRYLDRAIAQDQLVRMWVTSERRYAKRQLTWFKKQPGIHWFDINEARYEDRVTSLVRAWYTKK
ncbi:MAG: tRNA (adenosine(37)-N6)-dimethylallyltransferase MiaA [bacterium]|nr:tRNA (adenosine(37)-N6)-dimethylallyltransferase MiaA [bacterium]